jgi:uncharacterized membrane protein HdeD (DUF308 family)
MQGTQTYRTQSTGVFADLETWLGNTFAVILAGLGVASGVVGLLVAFGYIDTTINDPFENGIIWMIGGVILAISATVFRREHHIVDDSVRTVSRRYDETLPDGSPYTPAARR